MSTPSANTAAQPAGPVPPMRAGNVTFPEASAVMLSVRAPRFVMYGSVGSGVQMNAPFGQPLKSRTTVLPGTGLLAKSRTITVNGMSPMGQSAMHAGSELFAAEGTAAGASDVVAASSASARSNGVAIWFMGASERVGLNLTRPEV